MNFRPELAGKVMSGHKTVTRRRMSTNGRSPWCALHCSLKVGSIYAVCPGRGKHAIGYVRVASVTRSVLGDVDGEEARKEGFGSPHEFMEAWRSINGGYDPDETVWRVEFGSPTEERL